MIKLAVTGKGGVGKTTIAGTLARFFARDGLNVLAIDADPDMNLGSVLGCDVRDVTPISEKKELISKRTGSEPGQVFSTGVFKLNPKVDDITNSYGIDAPEGVRLILMGTVEAGGVGCMCPANSFLRALLLHLVYREKDAVILDMEPGVEHLGRATAEGVDLMLIVLEPGMKSVDSARRISNLAGDIGVEDIRAVLNKARGDLSAIRAKLDQLGIPVLTEIPYDENFVRADLKGEAPLDFCESAGIQAIAELEQKLLEIKINSNP